MCGRRERTRERVHDKVVRLKAKLPHHEKAAGPGS
jgi:hypothetical protein